MMAEYWSATCKITLCFCYIGYKILNDAGYSWEWPFEKVLSWEWGVAANRTAAAIIKQAMQPRIYHAKCYSPNRHFSRMQKAWHDPWIAQCIPVPTSNPQKRKHHWHTLLLCLTNLHFLSTDNIVQEIYWTFLLIWALVVHILILKSWKCLQFITPHNLYHQVRLFSFILWQADFNVATLDSFNLFHSMGNIAGMPYTCRICPTWKGDWKINISFHRQRCWNVMGLVRTNV